MDLIYRYDPYQPASATLLPDADAALKAAKAMTDSPTSSLGCSVGHLAKLPRSR